MTPAQAQRLAQHPAVREVEGEGCDPGYYFVHLREGLDFDLDPWYFRTSACFDKVGAAREALRGVIPIDPKSRKTY